MLAVVLVCVACAEEAPRRVSAQEMPPSLTDLTARVGQCSEQAQLSALEFEVAKSRWNLWLERIDQLDRHPLAEDFAAQEFLELGRGYERAGCLRQALDVYLFVPALALADQRHHATAETAANRVAIALEHRVSAP